MRYASLLFTFFFCSASTLASANSQGISIGQPSAVICVGITDPNTEGQFELVCHIHEQESHHVRSGSGDKEPIPFAASDNTSNFGSPGCDKPGDVVEQGFCLD